MECHQDSKRLFERGFFQYLPLLIADSIGLTGTLNFLLSRFDQTKYIGSLFTGILLGPSGIGNLDTFKSMSDNSAGGFTIPQLAASFGFIYFSFLVGVKIDMDMIHKAKRRTYIIGFSNFIIPLIFNIVVFAVLKNKVNKDLDLQINLISIAVLLSVHSFHDTSCALDDLNLLNSEIGRLSLSISVFTGVLSWLLIFVFYILNEALHLKPKILILTWVSRAPIILLMLSVRPVTLWMSRNTPEGTTLKERFVAVILISVLASSFYSSAIGLGIFFAPVMIGMVIPVGTPVGEALHKMLECFVMVVLMPAVYLVACSQLLVHNIQAKQFAVLVPLIFLAYIVKLISIMLSSLYCSIPIQDAFSLGLILQCDGTFSLLILSRACKKLYIDEKSYAIAVLTKAFLTMVATPIVKCISDPSRRYADYRRRIIQNSTNKRELRILACVYNQENVPSIKNFLATTSPTKDGPVCIYVLHLVELVGRAASVLVEHDKQQKQKQLTQSHSRSNWEQITNAFNKFEERNRGFTFGQSYTAVSPFVGMHNNVCEVAMEKRTNLVIIPFGALSENPIQAVNRSILHKAPCAVGILFDHINILPKSYSNASRKRHKVAMIFIGGPDDREALTYSMRIADEPHLKLSVFRFTHSELHNNTTRETKKDDKLVKELRKRMTNAKNIVYREEEVTDCGDTASKIRLIEETHDFILVGRQHDYNSPILLGLDEWCVYKELGVIGDLLVTSSVKGNYSVLIMKQ